MMRTDEAISLSCMCGEGVQILRVTLNARGERQSEEFELRCAKCLEKWQLDLMPRKKVSLEDLTKEAEEALKE
jgi:hypothetical protein